LCLSDFTIKIILKISSLLGYTEEEILHLTLDSLHPADQYKIVRLGSGEAIFG
jgi:hypothetical protein